MPWVGNLSVVKLSLIRLLYSEKENILKSCDTERYNKT